MIGTDIIRAPDLYHMGSEPELGIILLGIQKALWVEQSLYTMSLTLHNSSEGSYLI